MNSSNFHYINLAVQADPSLTQANYTTYLTNLTGAYNGVIDIPFQIDSSAGFNSLDNYAPTPPPYVTFYWIESFNSVIAPVLGSAQINALYCVDPDTCSSYSPFSQNFMDVGTIGPVPTPEPATWALLGASLSIFAFLKLKKAKSLENQ